MKITEIDDIDLEQYKIYKEYYENIQKETLKLCGIPKDLCQLH